MTDQILHECGIALIRLRKPLSYYLDKYGPTYAMNKMYILMEKQHNRGQDGAGVANIKIDVEPGFRYISRYRSIKPQPIAHLFEKISKKYKKGFFLKGIWNGLVSNFNALLHKEQCSSLIYVIEREDQEEWGVQF